MSLEIPISRTVNEIPFNKFPKDFTWEKFEELCKRIAKEEYSIQEIRPFGTKGDNQAGIDIYGFDTKRKKYLTIQCKRVENYNPAKIKEAVTFIQSVYNTKPIAGIVLGSGLGSFTSQMEIEKEIPYSEIPHFPVSTVEGHSGKLIFGKLSGKQVVAMAGRFHFYEGYAPQDVVFPIRVMKYLGISNIFLSNAAGATNTTYKVGDLMIITDHVSFFSPNPLIGKN